MCIIMEQFCSGTTENKNRSLQQVAYIYASLFGHSEPDKTYFF